MTSGTLIHSCVPQFQYLYKRTNEGPLLHEAILKMAETIKAVVKVRSHLVFHLIP